MKKIIIINILIIILILFSFELFIWIDKNLELGNDNLNLTKWLPFRPHLYEQEYNLNIENFPNEKQGWGRDPNGIEYSQKPIVLFGCSFAYGMYLKKEQTFSYKLSNLTKRPIYNRALTGWGIQHMLFQSHFEELYKKVPEPEYVIFTFIDDHIRRLYVLSVSAYDLITQDQYLRYKEKNNKLVQIKNENKLISFFKANYLVRELHSQYVRKHLLHDNNINKCHSFAIKHFKEAKENLQKHWENANYVVLFYDTENEFLKSELKKIGYNVITTKELTTENLQEKKYFEYKHPTEEAWNLLTPLIAKKLEIK